MGLISEGAVEVVSEDEDFIAAKGSLPKSRLEEKEYLLSINEQQKTKKYLFAGAFSQKSEKWNLKTAS